MNIVSAAPMLNPLGTQDLSLIPQTATPVAVPQFCPKQFFFAQKGPSNPQLTVGGGMVSMYGADTFDLRKKYANHSTVFANMFNANGNAMMTQRIVPADATTASMLLVVDVLLDVANQYVRDTTGAIVYDSVGNPTTVTPVNGGANHIPVYTYQFVWVNPANITMGLFPWVFGQGFHNGSAYVQSNAPASYGLATRTATDGTTTNKVYPLMEFMAGSAGLWGTNAGINIWAPTAVNNAQFPTSMLATEFAYPVNIQMVTRPDANSSAVVTPTILGSQSVAVVLQPGTIDPTTNAQMYIGDTLINQYQNLTDARFPNIYADLGNMAIYQNNIDTIQNMVTDSEAYANSSLAIGGHESSINYDGTSNRFTAVTGSASINPTSVIPGLGIVNYPERYAFNLFGGVTSNGTPYETWRRAHAGTVAGTLLSQHTPAWAFGGSDGTMDDLIFDHLVGNEMAKYLDPNDPIQELAVNVESVIVDSGYTLATKQKLLNLIAVRRDTAVILGTHQVTVNASSLPLYASNGTYQGVPIAGPVMNADQETSVAITLRTAAQLFPESDYFGTPCMRVGIFGRSANIINSLYSGKLPMTYDVASKFSQYMGASNGKWKSSASIDNAYSGASNVVTTMNNINITWVPDTARIINWGIGLNWVQAYDTRSYFYPAFKTVYSGVNSDSSVLNSLITVMAICQLNKVAAAAWRNFTNSGRYSPAQLVANVNNFINDQVSGIFDGRFVIIPDTQLTPTDTMHGYSFTTPIKIYARDMQTVMTTYIQAYNLSSYVPAA